MDITSQSICFSAFKYCYIIPLSKLPNQNLRTTMIAATNINLKVPFNEKDQAKSLGARWNAEAKLWYVPQGVDAAPFEKWVTSATNAAPNISPKQAAAKPTEKSTVKSMPHNNTSANALLGDDIDAINASLRDAYESNEDAF
jgi:hypothetical protein